jgi:hypothetical protein
MVLLDAAFHLLYELPYRRHYAHRRLARRGSSRSWSLQGRTAPRLDRPPERVRGPPSAYPVVRPGFVCVRLAEGRAQPVRSAPVIRQARATQKSCVKPGLFPASSCAVRKLTTASRSSRPCLPCSHRGQSALFEGLLRIRPRRECVLLFRRGAEPAARCWTLPPPSGPPRADFGRR